MIIASLADGLWRTTLPINLLWPGGLAAWLAALLLIKDTPTILRIQVGILIGAGMSFLVYSISQGATFHLLETLTSNTTMLSMIAAVGFLRLVSIPDTEIGQSLPVGKHAFFKTRELFQFIYQYFSTVVNCRSDTPAITYWTANDSINNSSILQRIVVVTVFWGYGGSAYLCTRCGAKLDSYGRVSICYGQYRTGIY